MRQKAEVRRAAKPQETKQSQDGVRMVPNSKLQKCKDFSSRGRPPPLLRIEGD